MSDSTKIQPVSIRILGKDYRFACSQEEQETLKNAAQELDEKMRIIRDSGKVNGADRIAVMAALNLTHDLRPIQSNQPHTKDDISVQLTNLRNKIENTLKIPKSS